MTRKYTRKNGKGQYMLKLNFDIYEGHRRLGLFEYVGSGCTAQLISASGSCSYS